MLALLCWQARDGSPADVRLLKFAKEMQYDSTKMSKGAKRKRHDTRCDVLAFLCCSHSASRQEVGRLLTYGCWSSTTSSETTSLRYHRRTLCHSVPVCAVSVMFSRREIAHLQTYGCWSSTTSSSTTPRRLCREPSALRQQLWRKQTPPSRCRSIWCLLGR